MKHLPDGKYEAAAFRYEVNLLCEFMKRSVQMLRSNASFVQSTTLFAQRATSFIEDNITLCPQTQ